MYDLSQVLTSNGINFPNLTENLQYFIDGLKTIYGENINLEQNSQDGQVVNIISQAIEDIQQVISFTYNSFDINSCSGRLLDRNVAYHGIARNSGSYTVVPIEVTFDRATSLQGLDDNYNNVNGSGFTVGDNNGNNFILITSTTEQQGTSTLYFRSQVIGEIQPNLNTIKNIITPQLGVVSVNNPSAPQQIGTEEETDYSLRNRFFQTSSLGGSGSFDNVKAAILNVANVQSVNGENNYQDTVSAQGTPAHTIWLIVQGGDDDDIANAIYRTISGGCGLRGNIVKYVADVYGNQNIIKFDRPVVEEYYVRFKITPKVSTTTFDVDVIKSYLVNNYVLGVGEKAEATAIDIVLNSGNDSLVYNEIEVSKDNSNWLPLVESSDIQHILTLSINNITVIS